MENLNIYQNIATTQAEEVTPDILVLLNENGLKEKVESQMVILDPICEVINLCQRKGASLADGAEAYLKLRIDRRASVSQKQNVKDRKEMALTEIALAAYYLDPFKDKTLLNRPRQLAAKSFVTSRLSENIRDQIIKYDTKFEENFLHIKEITENALDFWTLAEDSVPELAHIAIKLSQIPASTAQLERAFSMWQNIHSKVRNRLTFERSTMLMECYYYFSTMKEMGQINITEYI